MELDLQGSSGLHVHSLAETQQLPPSPRICNPLVLMKPPLEEKQQNNGKIASQETKRLFV
jgi:hypothetical protein